MKILDNGLRIYSKAMANTMSVEIGIYFLAGPLYETRMNNGISHLLEHLHFRKLRNFSQKELYVRMNCIGMSLHGTTYKDFMRFGCRVRPKYFCDAVDISKEILLADSWSEADIEEEKRVVLNQIAEKQDYMDVSLIADEIIWMSTPLEKPIIGTVSTVSKISSEQAREFKKRLCSPKSCVIVITGNINEKMLEYAYKTFSCEIPETRGVCPKNCSVLNIGGTTVRRCNWSVCEFVLAFPFSFDEVSEQTAALLRSIIGGGDGSFLQYRLIDELALVSNIWCELERIGKNGVFKVFFSCTSENSMKALRCVVTVLKSAKTEISEADLSQSSVFFTENLWFDNETPHAINFESGYSILNGGAAYETENEIKKYSAVTVEMLRKTASRIFRVDKATVAAVGDFEENAEKKIQEMLKKLF